MKSLTRREFLNTAGSVAGGAILSPAAFIHRSDTGTHSMIAMDQTSAGFMPPASIEKAIYPRPQEISDFDSGFILDSQVRIILPPAASGEDVFLARSLAHELSDWFNIQIKTERSDTLPANVRCIVMGSIQNPLVSHCCKQQRLDTEKLNPGPEGYILQSGRDLVLVAGSDNRGAFYGMQSLRQLIYKDGDGALIRGVRIRDWPDKPFRGIYLYLPGRKNVPFFKRFIRDYMALYKYNTLIMEMGASMRLESHPELNSGWVQFARDCNYSCRNYPPGPFHGLQQNSSHQDTGDGGFLEKEEVAELARWMKQNQIELIPEIASFTHSYYLLAGHRDLAAIPENKWPDIYCASNPKSYELVFEVYDEYIDLLQPKMIHIGHDELFLPVDGSPRCADKNIGELFGEDVKQIHDHLSARGIKSALWADMLLESVRGHGLQKNVAADGWIYYTPGGMTPDQVERLIPKDCLLFNWFWGDQSDSSDSAHQEMNEATLDKMGFQQVYGNFDTTIKNYEIRKQRSTLLGGAPSAWFATNEFGFGKELMSDFLGCSSILWTGKSLNRRDHLLRVQSMIPAIRMRLSGIVPPSQTETLILPLDISSKFNLGDDSTPLGTSLPRAVVGNIKHNDIPFELRSVNNRHSAVVGTNGSEPSPLPRSVTGIPIGASPTSLIFLHAAVRPAANRESFRLMWDQEDTADLLGWYEVAYEDGFVTTIPIRYGVNLLESNWQQRVFADDGHQRTYCYGADAVDIGGSAENHTTFFAYEWTNPRLGKVIDEIRLKGTTGFRGASSDFNNDWGPVIPSNGVILKAISMVQKRG